MKKTICLGMLILMTFFGRAYSQEQEKPKKEKMKPALLVIDIQNEYLPYMSEQDKKTAFEYINSAIFRFREHGFPVIRVYNTDPQWGPKPGTDGFEFPKSVIIQPDDPKIVKNYGNAFKKTELDKLLKDRGCNTLFLCGLSATGCVLATYFGAEDLDYPVFMIRDALISPDSSLTKSVEAICETVCFSAMRLMLENAQN